MSAHFKRDPNREGDQDSIWRKRAYFDEGTEFDIRWGFVAADFGEMATPEIMEREERLPPQVSGKK